MSTIDPTQPDPNAPGEPAQPDPAQPDPAQPEPAQPDQPQPDQPQSVLDRLKAVAPHVTEEFAKVHELADDYLERVANRHESPPPDPTPQAPSEQLHNLPGGWVNVPPGVAPEDANAHAISR